ncbi:MAG: TetR family transcriptional regulator [Candidatus Eremiobacteraeota bacterium]|nr:TetR family transcriptional regulator [Candidatus Eremiobacteraeota bacterium]
MPAPIVSKQEVLQRLTEAFRRVGYEGASMAFLAEQTGLKKASLYHYFPGGKKEMGEAALAQVGVWLQDEVLATLAQDKPPRERLQAMSAKLDEFYQSGQKWCLVDLFSVGEAGQHFQSILKEALTAWMNELARVAEEAGVEKNLARHRAEEALIALQGSLVMARALGQPGLSLRILRELPKRMLD